MDNHDIGQFEMLDISGKLVYTSTFKTTNNDPIFQIPELASGAYMWKVFLPSGNVSGKIIVE